jgi:hypothetical protein
MADPTGKVKPGDGLNRLFQAATFNLTMDTVNDYLRRMRGRTGAAGNAPDPIVPATLIYVKNATGSTLLPYSVVSPNGTPIYDPADEPVGQQQQPLIEVIAPASDSDVVLITQEEIADGEIGLAASAGVCVAAVAVSSGTHKFAAPTAGVTTSLASATSGPVRILEPWSSGTGERLVLIGSQTAGSTEPPPPPFSCGWVQSIRSEGCLLLSLESQAGACDCETNDVPDTVLREDPDAPGNWIGDPITVCGVEYEPRFFPVGAVGGLPDLTLTTTDISALTYASTLSECHDGYAIFAFGRDPPCSGTPATEECGDNTLRLRVACITCPGIITSCDPSPVPFIMWASVYPPYPVGNPMRLVNVTVTEWDNECLLDSSCSGSEGELFLSCNSGQWAAEGFGPDAIARIISDGDPYLLTWDQNILGDASGGTASGIFSSITTDYPTTGATISSTALGTATYSGVADTSGSPLSATVNAGELLVVEIASFTNPFVDVEVSFDGDFLAEIHTRAVSAVGRDGVRLSLFSLLVPTTVTGDIVVFFLSGTGDVIVKATAIAGLTHNRPERVFSGADELTAVWDTGTTGYPAWPDSFVHAAFAFACSTGSFSFGAWASGFATDEEDSVVNGSNTFGLTVGYKTVNSQATFQGTKTSEPTADWVGIVVSFI